MLIFGPASESGAWTFPLRSFKDILSRRISLGQLPHLPMSSPLVVRSDGTRWFHVVPLPNPPPDWFPRAHGMRRVHQWPRTGGTCWALEPGPHRSGLPHPLWPGWLFSSVCLSQDLFPHMVRVFLLVSSQCWLTNHWFPTTLRSPLYHLCPFAPVCSRSLGHLCPGCVCLVNKWVANSRIWDYPLGNSSSHSKMRPLRFQGMDCDLHGPFQSAPSSSRVMLC